MGQQINTPMRYRDIILTEGRDAPLYHGAPICQLLRILQADALGLPGRAVSLSRAPHVSGYFSAAGERMEWDYGGVLVLDQGRLAQRYAIKPHHDRWAELPDHSGFRDEQEEKINGPIQPLSRYLLSITINPAHLRQARKDDDFMTNSEDFARFFGADRRTFKTLIGRLLRHPLLNKRPSRLPSPKLAALADYDHAQNQLGLDHG